MPVKCNTLSLPIKYDNVGLTTLIFCYNSCEFASNGLSFVLFFNIQKNLTWMFTH